MPKLKLKCGMKFRIIITTLKDFSLCIYLYFSIIAFQICNLISLYKLRYSNGDVVWAYDVCILVQYYY